jgi:putative spermidine/putrescine transport system substrate-binding protein
MKKSGIFFLLIVSLFHCSSPKPEEVKNEIGSWDETLKKANGKTVTLMMWQGDPLINKYMSDYVVPEIKKQFNINLSVVGGQGNSIVSTLMNEMEAGKTSSEVDMMWINGETFFQLRQINTLYGPFMDQLPNNIFVDWDNTFVKYDFQQEVKGYECPWGNVQLAIIYNKSRVPNPPQTMSELEEWVKENPGKFTIGNDFTGMTLLKSWLIHLAGGKNALDGPYDEAKYKKFSAQLWEYVNRIKPYCWNKGKSFPESVTKMHQLFATGELWFTMSNNDGEVDNKILQGVFNDSSRAYVPSTGTIQNSHYMGIVKHSANTAAAMVVCNFLISPEAQWKKMQPSVWGDGTILAISKLSVEWQKKFANVPGRKFAPAREIIQPYALMEPDPKYMMNLFEDFRKEVMEK